MITEEIQLPESVSAIVDAIASMPGVVAIALGGSRALGCEDDGSDWDLGLYYRGFVELDALREFGTVFPPGSWGRLMNGGAWLETPDGAVDVMLRDLDTVEYWAERAEKGEFERDALLGYLAGAPTYLLAAELDSCVTLSGSLPRAPFPAALKAAAPAVWRFCGSFSLEYARKHARRGNVAGAVGQAAVAVMAEANALMCERRRWVCNEKRLIGDAGLDRVRDLFASAPNDPGGLGLWIDGVSEAAGFALV